MMIESEETVAEGAVVGVCDYCEGEITVFLNYASAAEPILVKGDHLPSCDQVSE